MIKQVMIAVILLAFSTITRASFLPPTPVPFKYGTGVIGNNIIYIGLGSAGKSWFKLDTNMRNGDWESMAVFPGDARELATSVMLDGRIYEAKMRKERHVCSIMSGCIPHRRIIGRN